MIEKLKELANKAFQSDIKSWIAWAAGLLGIGIGFRGKTAFERFLAEKKQEEKKEQPKGLRDKLRDIVNGTDKK